MLPPCTRDPEGLALLAACKENPVDVAPRFILSDWLEEQGEEDVARCLRQSISERESTVPLPKSAQERWQPFNACRDGWFCLRPKKITIKKNLHSLQDCEWFGAISFANLPAITARRHMIDQPALRHVVEMESSTGWLFPREFIGKPLVFENLASLKFNASQLDASDIESLCGDPRIKRLRRLDLGNSQLPGSCFRQLERATWLSELCDLSFRGIGVASDDLLKFVSDSRIANIESLNLKSAGSGDNAIRLISQKKSMPRMRRFAFRSMFLSTKGLRELFRCFASQPLDSLDLSENLFGDEGVKMLANWKGLSHIRRLTLRKTGLGSEGLAAIARSKYARRIESLDLGDNRLLDQNNLTDLGDLEAQELIELRLAFCELSAKSLVNLSRSSLVERLQSLRLCANRTGDPGVTALSEANLGQLRYLDLTENFITDDGVAKLAKAPRIGQLDTLLLGGNGISHRGIESLANAGYFEKLSSLFVNANPIGDEGILALAKCKWLPSVRRLQLCATNMTDRGLAGLIESPNLGDLQELYLWSNQITDAGADVLANCEQLESLTDLYISTEHLTDHGRKMLKNSPHLRHTLIHW